MLLYLNSRLDRIEVKPQSTREISFLEKFPGFGRDNGVSYCSAKPLVVKNIIRRIQSSGKIKNLSITNEVAELNTPKLKLLEIPSDFVFHTPPLRHQEIGLRFLYTNYGGGLLADPGLGKTKIIYDYIALSKQKKTWVVCPKALVGVWVAEQKKHRPDVTVYAPKSLTWGGYITNALSKRAKATSEKEIAKLDRLIESLKASRDEDYAAINAADVVVINYSKSVLGKDIVRAYPPTLMVLDEALVKDPKSLQTNCLTDIAHQTGCEVILSSGTLINNSPMDVFAPVRLMDYTLVGKSFFKFMERYCVMVAKDRSDPKSKKFPVGFKDSDEVKRILHACSIVLRKEEWLDLPEKIFIPVKVPVSQQMREFYETLAANHIAELNGVPVEVDSALTAHAKLSQIGSGFVYRYDDEESLADMGLFSESKKKVRKVSDREVLFFDDQPKIRKLIELLTGDLKSRKLILWYNLTTEFNLIQKALTEAGISFDFIKGGEKNTWGKVERFNQDETLQVLICQARSVNYGITVLGKELNDPDEEVGEVMPNALDPRVYTHVFFSLSYSLEIFLQQQDRSHRIGTTRSPEYYMLLADLPIEMMVNERLQQKQELREEFLVDSLAAVSGKPAKKKSKKAPEKDPKENFDMGFG